jgi:hypothetical protein
MALAQAPPWAEPCWWPLAKAIQQVYPTVWPMPKASSLVATVQEAFSKGLPGGISPHAGLSLSPTVSRFASR